MTLAPNPEPTIRPPRRTWLLAAAAAVVIALAIGVVTTSGGDEGGIADGGAGLVTEEAPRTFVGGTFESLDLGGGEHPPYRIEVTADFVVTMALDGTLAFHDPDTLAILETMQVADSSDLAIGDDGVLWVADAVDGTVERIERGVGVTAVVETGIRVEDETFRGGRTGQLGGAGGTYARIGSIDVEGDSVWVTDLDGRLLRIDALSAALTDEIKVDVQGHIVRAEGELVLLGDQSRNVVQVVDTAGEVVLTSDRFERVVGADLLDDQVYVWDRHAVLTRIDTTDGDVTATESLGEIQPQLPDVPHFPHAPLATPAGVVTVTTEEIIVVDPLTLEVLRAEPAEVRFGEMAAGPGGDAWVVHFPGRTVHHLGTVPR